MFAPLLPPTADASYPAFGISDSFMLDSPKYMLFDGSNYDDMTDMGEDAVIEQKVVEFTEQVVEKKALPVWVWLSGRVNQLPSRSFSPEAWAKSQRHALIFAHKGPREKPKDKADAQFPELHAVAETLKGRSVKTVAVYSLDIAALDFDPKAFDAKADTLYAIRRGKFEPLQYKGKLKKKAILRWASKKNLLSRSTSAARATTKDEL